MGCARLKTGIFWNRRNKFSRLKLDGGYTGNRYIWWVSLSGKLLKKISYCRHGNTPLPEKRKYNSQCCDDPTIQHFMWGDPSELKSENNSKGSVSDGLHIRNKMTLNDERLIIIPCMVIPHLQLPRKHVSYTIRYFYNEQQVLCQG